MTPYEDVYHYKKLELSLIMEKGCLLFGTRIVIQAKLRNQVLQLIHLGDFGMQQINQLACSVVHWVHINDDIKHYEAQRQQEQCTILC